MKPTSYGIDLKNQFNNVSTCTCMMAFKATMWEVSCNNGNVRKISGYSPNIDIVNKTVQYYEQSKSKGSSCTRPIVTITTLKMTDEIAVDDLVKNTSYIVPL